MNSITRIIWLSLNLFFGAPLACLLFAWAACDMQVPLDIKDFTSTYLPIFNPIFDVPYVHINQVSDSIIAKLIFNAFLVAIFGFMHTLFAQEFVHNILSRFLFPKQALRTVYCMITSMTAFIIIGFWQHTHIQLWNFLPKTMNIYQQQHILLILYSIIFIPAWYVIIKFNPFEFCGVKQIFGQSENSKCPFSSVDKSENRTTGTPALITSGLFRLCRHPLYLFTILAWAITPVMSLDRLVFIIYICLYALIGIPVEERKLVQIFGQAYVNYQKHVPAIFPVSIIKTKQN
ncbi:unnamed protein product [Adineta steineri]|uniref:Nuclear envelope membrane protein n=1 Tax=Adineta steineri TaxID=433720 RepID=A0A813SNV5_9BILA|nr:unnamed protein product [Adineta steineri]CAF3713004.1 unnamed protein product [Adineta steineri]